MNDWITHSIKIFCKYKWSLFAFTKNNNDPKENHYTKYSKILIKI
jgi:hypothetical protein